MNKKYIYTVGYTLFQQGNTINVNNLFDTLKKYDINFLVDVRSVPFSKQYPQCNADNMKIAGKHFGIPYMNMPEIGAKASSQQEVFSKASDIFFEQEIFPIAKSYRPEKTELLGSEEIVDFRKFRNDEIKTHRRCLRQKLHLVLDVQREEADGLSQIFFSKQSS